MSNKCLRCACKTQSLNYFKACRINEDSICEQHMPIWCEQVKENCTKVWNSVAKSFQVSTCCRRWHFPGSHGITVNFLTTRTLIKTDFDICTDITTMNNDLCILRWRADGQCLTIIYAANVCNKKKEYYRISQLVYTCISAGKEKGNCWRYSNLIKWFDCLYGAVVTYAVLGSIPNVWMIYKYFFRSLAVFYL